MVSASKTQKSPLGIGTGFFSVWGGSKQGRVGLKRNFPREGTTYWSQGPGIVHMGEKEICEMIEPPLYAKFPQSPGEEPGLI